jgi:hypothetical protein
MVLRPSRAAEHAAQQQAEAPAMAPEALEAFRRDVKDYMEADTAIAQVQATLRDLRRRKQELSQRVMAFMASHKIDDLDVRGELLRYKVTSVRAPLRQRDIRERMEGLRLGADAIAAVLARRAPTAERPSLRRLRVL